MLIRPPKRGRARTSYRGFRLAFTMALGATAMVTALLGLARLSGTGRRVKALPPPDRSSAADTVTATLSGGTASRAEALARAADGVPRTEALRSAPFALLWEELRILDPEQMSARLRRDVLYESLLERPADARGHYLRMRGTLVHLGPVDVEAAGGKETGYQGRLLDLRGRPVMFVVREDPRVAFPEGQVSPAKRTGAQVDGAFLQVVFGEDVAGKRRPAPLVIGRRLAPARVVAPSPELAPKGLTEREYLLRRVVDQRPLAIREHRLAYYYLLNEVHELGDAALRERVDPQLGYDDFVDTPDLVRGAYLQLHGALLRLEETAMDPHASGFTRVFEGQIHDAERRPISFVLTEDPRPEFEPGKVGIYSGGPVTLEGVFLMNIAFLNVGGKHTATPLVLARGLIRRPGPGSGAPSWPVRLALIAFATFCLAALAGLVFINLSSRRSRRRLDATDASRLVDLDRMIVPEVPPEVDPDEVIAESDVAQDAAEEA